MKSMYLSIHNLYVVCTKLPYLHRCWIHFLSFCDTRKVDTCPNLTLSLPNVCCTTATMMICTMHSECCCPYMLIATIGICGQVVVVILYNETIVNTSLFTGLSIFCCVMFMYAVVSMCIIQFIMYSTRTRLTGTSVSQGVRQVRSNQYQTHITRNVIVPLNTPKNLEIHILCVKDSPIICNDVTGTDICIGKTHDETVIIVQP